jgi:hypothetical protein
LECANSLVGGLAVCEWQEAWASTGSANNNIINNMTAAQQAQGITEQRWQKPARGRLECNVDAYSQTP